MVYVKSFRELEVYKLSRKLSKEIFELTRSFPKEEAYSLIDQIRRSSRSVGAQIAEAWGKRKYEKHFISKLTDADGEQLETQHWIETELDCFYISGEQNEYFTEEYDRIGKMLSSMMKKSSSFCKKPNNTDL
ncbi:MAG: four helix bundle protein [Chitinophagaceae bacterium]